MLRKSDFKFQDEINSPLMKLKVESDEIKLVFDPTSYIHLVNISRCF